MKLLALCAAGAALLGGPPAHFTDVDLRGLWRSEHGSLVEIRGASAAAQLGYLAKIDATFRRVGYELGQKQFDSITVRSDSLLRMVVDVHAVQPSFPASCRKWVEFTGTVDKARTTIRGSRSSVLFEPNNDDPSIDDGCKATLQTDRVAETYTLIPSDSNAKLMLKDLRVDGLFTHHESYEPPYVPIAVVNAAGRFTLYFPSAWAGEQANVLLDEVHGIGQNGELQSTTVMSRANVAPHAESGKSYATVRLPDLFPELLQLDGGPYVVSAVFHSPGASRVTRRYRSPLIDRNDLLLAWNQQIDQQSLDLFGIPYATWRLADKTNASSARDLRWKQLYRRATGFSASVELTNLSDKDVRFTSHVRLDALLGATPGKTESSFDVVLGAARPTAKAWAVAPSETRRIDFAPFSLDATPDASKRMIAELSGFEARAHPGDDSTKLDIDAEAKQALLDGFADPRQLLATAMRLLGPFADPPADVGTAPDDPGVYVRAKDFALSGFNTPPEAVQKFSRGAAMVDSELTAFLAARDRYASRFAKYGDTGLDALDEAMLGHKGSTLHFGGPGATIGDTNTASSTRPCGAFDLTNSSYRIGMGFLSSMVNPDLSFAQDPAAFLRARLDSTTAGSSRPMEIPGQSTWVWENQPAQLGLEMLYRKDLRDAFSKLLDPADGRLSDVVSKHLRNDHPWETVRGRLHEEMSFNTIVADELARLRSQSQHPDRIVAIRGENIAGTTLEGKRGQQLTDGVIVEMVDGQLRIHRISEDKAGQASANGIGNQVGEDIARILKGGIQFKDLPIEAQRALGLSGPDASFSAQRVAADFRDPNVFVTVVPQGVTAGGSIDLVSGVAADLAAAQTALANASPAQRAKAQAAVAKLQAKLAARQQSQADVMSSIGGDAGRTALENHVHNDTRRTSISAADLGTLTDAVFDMLGKERQPWDEKRLSLEQFKRVTEQNLPDGSSLDDYSQDELVEHWLNGDRFDPETQQFEPALDPWQRPYMSSGDVLDLWRNSVSPRTAADPDAEAKAHAKADAGKRYNPETGQFFDPGTDNSAVYTIDPGDPLLPGSEFVAWWERAHDQVLSQADADALLASREGKVFDPATGNFRPPRPNTDEAAMVKLRDEMDSDVLDWMHQNHQATARAIEDLGNAAADGMQRWAAALNEVGKLRDEHLHVSLTCSYDGTAVWASVQLFARGDGGDVEVPLASSQQENMLKSWYAHSNNFWSTGELPAWLQRP